MRPQQPPCPLMSTLPQNRDELKSLLATGRNDLLCSSVEHLGGMSLWWKTILFSTSMWWTGWETLFRMLTNLDSILSSITASRDSSLTPPPITEPVFLTSLVSSFASYCRCLWASTGSRAGSGTSCRGSLCSQPPSPGALWGIYMSEPPRHPPPVWIQGSEEA